MSGIADTKSVGPADLGEAVMKFVRSLNDDLREQGSDLVIYAVGRGLSLAHDAGLMGVPFSSIQPALEDSIDKFALSGVAS